MVYVCIMDYKKFTTRDTGVLKYHLDTHKRFTYFSVWYFFFFFAVVYHSVKYFYFYVTENI